MGKRKIQAGGMLCGLCCTADWLHIVEGRQVESSGYSWSLAVYQVDSDSGDITLLDRLELEMGEQRLSVCPRVDRHSWRVFVPLRGSGVTVARLDGDRLIRHKTLTCVRDAVSVDVKSPDEVYVSDWSSRSVYIVNVRDDRITSVLEKPETVSDEWPRRLAVLGDSVMVGYTGSILVVYHHGSPAPVRVIPRPAGLGEVIAISTDWHSNFLLTDYDTSCLFAMDVDGNVRHKVNIDSDSMTEDCAVVRRQPWVGCRNGDIVIMSSQ